jgi:hypothetical protein
MDNNQNQSPGDLPVNDPKVQAAIADLANITAKQTESMADVVEEFEEKQNDFQAMYSAGGKFARDLEEIARGYGRKGGVEMEPSPIKVSEGRMVEVMEEIPTSPEVEKKLEKEGYIEKVEKETAVPPVIVDDYTQQVLLKPTFSQSPKIILPLTEEQVEKGLHEKVWESFRWLAEWCLRQIKMLAGRAEYKKTGADNQ